VLREGNRDTIGDCERDRAGEGRGIQSVNANARGASVETYACRCKEAALIDTREPWDFRRSRAAFQARETARLC
jgi:hypothetical protein